MTAEISADLVKLVREQLTKRARNRHHVTDSVDRSQFFTEFWRGGIYESASDQTRRTSFLYLRT